MVNIQVPTDGSPKHPDMVMKQHLGVVTPNFLSFRRVLKKEKETSPKPSYHKMQNEPFVGKESKYESDIFDLPCGTNVVRWNVEKKERMYMKQLHQHTIAYLKRLNDALTLSISYMGEVQVWKTDNYTPVWKEPIELHIHQIVFVSVSYKGNFLTLATDRGQTALMKLKWEGEELLGMETHQTNESGNQYITLLNQAETFLLSVQKVKNEYLFTSQAINSTTKGNILLRLDVEEIGTKIHCIQLNKDQSKVCLCTIKRKMIVFDLTKEHDIPLLIPPTTIKGTGLVAMQFGVKRLDTMYFSSSNGKVYRYSCQDPTAPHTVYAAPPERMLSIEWKQEDETSLTMIGQNESGIFHWKLARDSDKCQATTISLHNLTCCGVAFHQTGDYIATGDFTGKVYLWSTKNTKSVEPLADVQVNGSVRSLSWKPQSETVVIGTLDGFIYEWDTSYAINASNGNVKPTPARCVMAVNGGVTSMQWSPGKSKKLAIGTTTGYLVVLGFVVEQSCYQIQLCILAHRPWNGKDPRFGSLTKYAEIWSLSWSPESNFIATASEDQTVAIWCAETGKRVMQLVGHSTAVTSVQWCRCSSLQSEVIFTCADDQHIMVWRNNATNPVDKTKWMLHHVCDSKDSGLNWHTLTYLAVNPMLNQVAVVTAHGYILVFDFVTKSIVAVNKIHTGSIEGLVWMKNSNQLATVSSDCTAAVFSYPSLNVLSPLSDQSQSFQPLTPQQNANDSAKEAFEVFFQ